MAFVSPAPSMMVVFPWWRPPDGPCRGPPAWAPPASGRPPHRSAWPPVRTAMSFSISFRRSPKPGALTARALKVPRSLLTISVVRASPSISSTDDDDILLPGLGDLLEERQDLLDGGDLLSVTKMDGRRIPPPSAPGWSPSTGRHSPGRTACRPPPLFRCQGLVPLPP